MLGLNATILVNGDVEELQCLLVWCLVFGRLIARLWWNELSVSIPPRMKENRS